MSRTKMTKEASVEKYEPSVIEIQRRHRIRLSVAAYSYEFYNDSIMSDADYDKLSLLIDVSINTNNEKLDKFFREEFGAHTGMWIRKHPDLDGLERIYRRVFRKPKKKKGDTPKDSIYTWHKSF